MHEARRGVLGVGESADDMMADPLQASSSGSGLAVPRGPVAVDERLTVVPRPLVYSPTHPRLSSGCAFGLPGRQALLALSLAAQRQR